MILSTTVAFQAPIESLFLERDRRALGSPAIPYAVEVKSKKQKVESHGKSVNTTQSHVDVMECRVLQYSAGRRKQDLYSPLKLLSKSYIGISLVLLYLFRV